MKSLIVDSQLYFPSPSSFNDPLDCRIPPNFAGSALTIESYWRRAISTAFPHLSAVDRKRKAKQQTLESKTPDGQGRLTERLLTGLNARGVACLSKNPTNMLLWSYYADGHSGIAVQFNMAMLGKLTGYFALEVRYRSEFPDFSYYKSSDFGFVHNIVGTKAKAWEHEQEWRIVLVDHVGYLTLPPGMIDGVILGMRISPQSEAAVRSWVKQRGALKLLRIVHKPRSFELALEPA